MLFLTLASLLACGEAPGAGGGDLVLGDSEVRTFGESESIAVARDMVVQEDGSVWVLNSLEPLFIGFDSTGRVIRAHGAFGGGPTEFGAPSAFVSGGLEGEAWVFDAERHALIEVSAAGAPRSEILLPRDSVLPPTGLFGGRELIGAGVRTAALGDEIVFARSVPSMAGGMISLWRAIWAADLVAYDPATGSVRDVVSLADLFGDPSDAFQLRGDFPPFPFWFRLWAVCPGDEIRVYDRLSNQVRAFSADGSELAPDPLPPPVLSQVTPTQFARVAVGLGMAEAGGDVTEDASPADSAVLIERLSRRLEGDERSLASLLPRYVDLHCSTDGTLWLRRFDIDQGGLAGGPTWLRISTQGAVREVRLPPRFDPLRFTADRIWGVHRDAFDVASVAWVPTPGPR